jgi:hypothetical protein|tara:strand:+ start:884 stop:1141 length:258 start_codon:yes stop_codon:yes gene_type:complete
MESEIKKDAHILCQRIRELTNQIDKKIDTTPTSIKTNFLLQNQAMENIKLDIKEKKIFDRPPAGKKVTKWDNTILYWKSSLRHPW